MNEEKKKQSIDALNERLYYKNETFGQRERRKIHGRKIDVKHDFEYAKKQDRRSKFNIPKSFFQKLFFVALFMFLGTAIFAGFSLYNQEQEVSADYISMDILGQPFVDGGETLELQVRIQNFNDKKLELPDLVLSYPKDSGEESEEVFLRRSLPDLEKGKRATEEFKLVLFGKEGDKRNIHATLEYRIEGSSAIFVKEFDHEVIIRSTPTDVSIQAPTEIVEGQDFEMAIDIHQNSNRQMNNLLLDINYPLGFEFVSANVDPTYGTHLWHFDHLKLEGDDQLIIKGKIDALPGQGKTFHLRFGKQNMAKKNEIETVFNRVSHTIDIQRSFIATKILVNGKEADQHAMRGGKSLNIQIQYENTLDTTLSDAQIVAHLSGNLYSKEGVSYTEGQYNSNLDTIIWDKDTKKEFASLAPGQKGSVSFSFQPRDLVGRDGSIVNPEFTFDLDVFGTELGGATRDAFAVDRTSIIANSDLGLIAKTLYHDGPFTNHGPIPPRVGMETEYTITLQITNSSNDVQDAEVRTTLPNYVKWLGAVVPSVERQSVSYDRTSRELVWKAKNIPSGTGVGLNQPRQLSFQIELLPSLAWYDKLVPLTKDIILSGTDSFTKVKLSYNKRGLTTSLKADSSSKSGDGLVDN